MSGQLPSDTGSDAPRDVGELRVLDLDDEDAERLICSLSSKTARSILSALHDEPATATELSKAVSTSVQNVRHHLTKLQAADLVEVVDTRYSVKGREMKVYAPATDPLVVCVGPDDGLNALGDDEPTT